MSAACEARILTGWQVLGMRVRLALYPDDTALLRSYLRHGDLLIAHYGHAAWSVHDRMLRLLLDTACDPLLPIAWRTACLEASACPMGVLGRLVHDAVTARRLCELRHRQANYIRPSVRDEHPR